MASGVFRSAVCEVIDPENCVEGSKRCTRMKEEGRKLLGGAESRIFDDFSEELVSTIKTCVEVSGRCRSAATWREKAQVNFHKVRVTKIPALWSSFYSQMGIKMEDPLLLQSVSQRIFDTLLVQHMSSKAPSRPPVVHAEQLNRDEDNALRYACGYVPFKLLKKYKQQSNGKAMQFVTCLTKMAANDDQNEGTFEDYTIEWLQKVNRGGLFCVSDQSYEFFRTLECQVRARLPRLLTSQMGTKEELVRTIIEDQDVEFLWTMLSIDIDDEADACALLQEIVELWVTIRGFSTTSSWLEQYKRAKEKTTKKTKGLRKSLSRRPTSEL